jgi:hypothetical protein
MDSSCGQVFIVPLFPVVDLFCSGIACGKASFWFFCRVGAPPLLKTETDPVSETLCFLFVEIPTMDKVQKLSSNECYTPSSEPFREECRLLGYKNPVCTSQKTYYASITLPIQLMLCKILCFHGSDYEECRLLGYYAMWLL